MPSRLTINYCETLCEFSLSCFAQGTRLSALLVGASVFQENLRQFRRKTPITQRCIDLCGLPAYISPSSTLLFWQRESEREEKMFSPLTWTISLGNASDSESQII